MQALDVNVEVAQPAAVDPNETELATRRACSHVGQGGQAVIRVQHADRGLRQARAPQVHAEPARRAVVQEDAGGDFLAAQVTDAPAVVVGAGEGEVVPQVREEGAQGLRVLGALLVQVEIAEAVVAAVAAAGELLPAQVTEARQVVLRPQLELVLGMGEVGYRHGHGVDSFGFSSCYSQKSFGRGASDGAGLGVGFSIIMTILEIALIGVTDPSFLFALIDFYICLD